MTSRPDSGLEFATQFRALSGGAKFTDGAAAEYPLYTHFDPVRVPLFYDVTEDSVRKLRSARDAFSIITQCDYVWHYDRLERTDDWKRNAGVRTLVTRSRVFPRLVDEASGLDSNVVFGFCIGDSGLFLLPDGLVTNIGNRYQAVEETLTVNASTCTFCEDEVAPRDGEIVGRTWRYVNKGGGPDRRFNDNREIPIYRYGQIEIGCGSGRYPSVCLGLTRRTNLPLRFARL